RRKRMAMMMKRTAPRSTLRKIIKKHKPQLRLAANVDLLVRRGAGAEWHLNSCFCFSLLKIHLNFLLFLHRLAEEARTNAFENRSKIIKPEHAIVAAKVI
ncbi:CENPW protein, partial [Dromaius novaehollandiae]|nr:CENPW protein [Dromaius novaehollandiae]